MKKLSLDKTWTECLRMWRWIAKEVKGGNSSSVQDLKEQWLKEHGYMPIEIDNTCFFCEYAKTRTKRCSRGGCPGEKVDPEFNCMAGNYDYENKPIAFYNKLVALNRKRKRK